MQGAFEKFVDDAAQAVTDAAICNLVSKTLSDFSQNGEFTTDPGKYACKLNNYNAQWSFNDVPMYACIVVKLTIDPATPVGLFEIFPVARGGVNLPISLESVAYDCATGSLMVSTRSYGSQTIIPDVMVLENIALSVSLVVTDVKTLVVEFSGEWSISTVTLDVRVTYTKATGDFDIAATPSGVSVDLVSLADELTGLSLPNPFGNALTFNSFAISGRINTDRTVTLTVKVGSQAFTVYLIYHKPSQEAAQKAIAADFLDYRFSSLISQVTGVDLSGVPYFGPLTAPRVGLTISTGDIDIPVDVFAESDLLSQLLTSNGDSIASGVCAAMQFDVIETPIKMSFRDSTLKYMPLDGSIDVLSLLSLIPGVDFDTIPVPFDISFIHNIDITSFTLSSDTERAMCIEVDYQGGLGFFNNLITIDAANVNLCLSRSPTKVRVEVSGELTVESTVFTVQLSLDDEDKYVIMASANELPISDAISHFEAAVFPPELQSLLSNIPFVQFSVKNPSLTYPLSSVPKQIQLEGTPVIDGFEIVTSDMIIIREESGTSLVEGFEIGATNLAGLLQTISGFNFNSIPLLNQHLEAAILISPVSLPDVTLQGEKLQDFSITKGVSLQAELSFPNDCSSDAFCAVAQFLLNEDSRFTIRGSVESLSEFSLFAGVSDISLSRGLTISSAGLEVKAGTKIEVGITGSIELTNPPITLTSRVFLGTSGVELSLTEGGCWDRAFDADWLSICNILGSIGLAPGVVISTVEIGGEVKLGDPTCSTPITATGFLGIDAVTPPNSYYYVQFSDGATVMSLLEAFCVDVSKLPRPLGESGFPHGFLSSFSLRGHELPHAGLSIPAGFRLNGTLNILGLEGSADVNIDLPNGIAFAVQLPPISIENGLLRMTNSASDRSRGPNLMAAVTLLPRPFVGIAANGYMEVLGISESATLMITDSKYEFSISGNMLNLLQADLMLSAAYGDLTRASFRVKGSFRNDLYATIENQIKKVLKETSGIATEEINDAQRKLDGEQAKFDDAIRNLQSAQREVDKANAGFDSAERKLRDAENHAANVCRLKSCREGIN